ncbi:PTS sugar transporter subunit IIB [Mammaliicoccus lentus]|uniref:PTS sugar transporter subunit IIB n=1 Tax=Mammaliicoccus lentus TaxID=42858 RepID=UPI002DBB14A8|nr:PTS sugar transporter subunit IIB [Mammaliicoccus lentus]MEB8090990.1 PTS sugar transporter subunit IIB [Mammaliicoccus lentus]
MAEKTIVLVCAAGMSTSMLVKKMQEAAIEQGLDREIYAIASSEVDKKLSEDEINVLLLGPQVRFLKNEFESKVSGKNIPVEVIPNVDYGTMNGTNVLKLAESLTN